MSIIDGAKAMGARWAEARMTATCAIGSESEVLDETTGAYSTVLTAVWSGPCEVSSPMTPVEVIHGSADTVTAPAVLAVPLSTIAPIAGGMVAVVNGHRFRIVKERYQLHATKRRFDVEAM